MICDGTIGLYVRGEFDWAELKMNDDTVSNCLFSKSP